MALNQLQYMSLRTRVVKYADMRTRLMASAKDEDISPFSAVDKSVSQPASDNLVFGKHMSLAVLELNVLVCTSYELGFLVS